MESEDEQPVLTELEDSLRRLHQMMEWRDLGDRIRARRRDREVVQLASDIMAAQEHVSPQLSGKRARLLKLVKDVTNRQADAGADDDGSRG